LVTTRTDTIKGDGQGRGVVAEGPQSPRSTNQMRNGGLARGELKKNGAKGNYTTTPPSTQFSAGLQELKKENRTPELKKLRKKTRDRTYTGRGFKG